MKPPGRNLSEFEKDALGVVLSAPVRAGSEVAHLMFANRPYLLPPSRSLAPDKEVFIGSLDMKPGDSIEVGMYVQGDWSENSGGSV